MDFITIGVFALLALVAIGNSPAHNSKKSDGACEPHSENLRKLFSPQEYTQAIEYIKTKK